VHCITVVLAAFGVRFLMYSFLTNPWTFLPVELLQGVTYGVFYSTMVSYANKISPPGTAATVQGVVQSAFLGIGKYKLTFSIRYIIKYTQPLSGITKL